MARPLRREVLRQDLRHLRLHRPEDPHRVPARQGLRRRPDHPAPRRPALPDRPHPRPHHPRPASYRFVGNDHWRFAWRRACFRAQTKPGAWEHGIAKRSIRFASDEVKFRDWTDGTDYVEFAFTRNLSDYNIGQFLHEVGTDLSGRMSVTDWLRHPANAVTIRSDVDTQLLHRRDRRRVRSSAVPAGLVGRPDADPMRLKVEGGYFAPASEQVNAKDYVEDIWAVQDGHRVHVRMLLRGRPNPYNIVAALMGKPPGCRTPSTPPPGWTPSPPPTAPSTTSCARTASSAASRSPPTCWTGPTTRPTAPAAATSRKAPP
jgi:hypothetical protein